MYLVFLGTTALVSYITKRKNQTFMFKDIYKVPSRNYFAYCKLKIKTKNP